MSDVTYHANPYACAEGADAVVVVTEWEQFRALDLERLRAIMARPVLIDLRNVYPPELMARHGFVYVGVGRGIVDEETGETVMAGAKEAGSQAPRTAAASGPGKQLPAAPGEPIGE